MFSWFKKEQWKLVKILAEDVTHTNRNSGEKIHGKVYFILFESNKGNRKTEMKSNLRTEVRDLLGYKDRSEMYLTKVYRWEMGRPDPEIPSYNTVAEEDTVNALKGTI